MMEKLILALALFGLLIPGPHAFGTLPPDDFRRGGETSTGTIPGEKPNPWSYQAGVALITSNTIDEFPLGRFNRAKGDSGGEVWLMQVSRTLRVDEWTIAGRVFQPTLEMPLVLGLVNERGRNVFRDYNLGLTVRWRDFPWNEVVTTRFETGLGLSYTDRIMRIEEDRNPGRDRSHLKFYWPLQVMLAHPRHPQHQAVLFIHHQSGGHVFDKGGSNLIGLGYRYVPGEIR